MVILPLVIAESPWIQPADSKSPPRWGVEGELQFAVWPAGFKEGSTGGPRGLIRIGYPVLDGGKRYDLVQYIAIEPVVRRRKGFSELEQSVSDGKQGKLIAARDLKITDAQLSVTFDVEKFENGAHVAVGITQHRNRPNEVVLTPIVQTGSAPIEEFILTATMGNYARLRQLWLKDKIVNSRDLYRDYRGKEFSPDAFFPLHTLFRNRDGDVLVPLTTDEENPAATNPNHPRGHWHWKGEKLTQYWRVPRASIQSDLEFRVNARRNYWASQSEIPNGISFENFELREKFYRDQQFIFGLTHKTPAEMGFK